MDLEVFPPYFWKRPYITKRINSYESYSSKLDLTSPGAPHQIRHLYQSKKDDAKQREKLHLHSPPCIAVQNQRLIWAPRRILATPVGLLFAKLPAYHKSHISPKMIQSSKYKSVNGPHGPYQLIPSHTYSTPLVRSVSLDDFLPCGKKLIPVSGPGKSDVTSCQGFSTWSTSLPSMVKS